MSNPTSSQSVPDTLAHPKADTGERSRSFTTTNSICVSKREIKIPLLSLFGVCGHGID